MGTCQGISAPPAPKLNMVGASKSALLAVVVFCLAGTLVSCDERFDRSYSSEGSEAASLNRKRRLGPVAILAGGAVAGVALVSTLSGLVIADKSKYLSPTNWGLGRRK